MLTDEHQIAATSRYSRSSRPWPDTTEEEQVEYLLSLADRRSFGGWVIFPTGDETAALVGRNHPRLAERFRLSTPPWSVLQWAYDKRLTYRLAAQLGIDHPWTHQPVSRDDVAALDCAFPVILKPAVRAANNSFTYAKAWRADDRSALVEAYDQASRLIDPELILIQELIPGGGREQLSYAALCLDGQPQAWLTARRTRQYPPDFGRSSSFVETISQPAILSPSERFLEATNFTGLVELEFKLDSRDGRYKLLDVNPRVWGWHSISGRAGVDFPYLLWQLIQGRLHPGIQARSGVQWVRMVMDLPAATAEIRACRLSLRAYLRSLRSPLEFAIMAFDDPIPGLLEVPLLSYLAWKRRQQKA